MKADCCVCNVCNVCLATWRHSLNHGQVLASKDGEIYHQGREDGEATAQHHARANRKRIAAASAHTHSHKFDCVLDLHW
jgi:hypothetical protein